VVLVGVAPEVAQTIVALGIDLRELHAAADLRSAVEQILSGRRVAVSRLLVGNYITSLDMAGCAITLVRADDELLSLWDDPVLTPALRWGI
jgi:dihydroxyacetone kinase-like protein